MSRNIRINWNWPTTREDNEPLREGDISHLIIAAKLKAAPASAWEEIANVPFDADTVSRRFTDVPSGTWEYRLTVFGSRQDDVSDHVVVEAPTLEHARIGPVTEVTIEVE